MILINIIIIDNLALISDIKLNTLILMLKDVLWIFP